MDTQAKSVKELKWVGKNVTREDGAEKATGKGIFATDMSLPHMLHGRYSRSKTAHARILHIDASKALKVPGVKAVITSEDCPKDGAGNLRAFGPYIQDHIILAHKKVRYIGEAVAAVAATDEDAAEEAADLIRVDYEELPAVFDPVEAMSSGAPILHENLEQYGGVPGFKPIRFGNVACQIKLLKGDPDKAFQEADCVLEQKFRTVTHHQCYLEPHAALAQVDAKGRATVWTSTQTVSEVRRGLMETLGLPASQIRAIAPFIGGGFGGKLDICVEPHAVLLARKTDRPVKIVLTREEEFISGHPRHPFLLEYKTGAKKDGRIIAREARFIVDSGAYATHGPGVMGAAITHGRGPYAIPNVRIEASLVYTNKLPFGGYRGYGSPQTHFAGESQMDDLAKELGMDPIGLRMKNAITEGQRLATGQPLRHTAYKETLRRAAESAGWDWENRKRPVRKPQDRRKKTGFGVASNQHVSAIFASGAILKMEADGAVTVLTGGTEVGAGQRTVLSQIAAEALSVPYEKVSIVMSDTLTTPYDWSTDASRTTYNIGNAILRAAAEVKEKLLEIAAAMLEADPKDLEMESGEVYVRSAPDRRATYHDVVMYGLYVGGGVILGKGSFFDPPAYERPKDTQVEGWRFVPIPAFSYGTQIAEVEVDTETGRVEVTRLHSACDVGKAISPAGCEGQIEGAVSMSVGWILSEEMVFEGGAVANPTFLDYKVPTTLDVPKVHPLLVEEPDPTGPFGAKGIGEPPLVPTAAAVANAIRDAIGVRICEMPFSPDRVLAALRKNSRL
ncbi:MAG: xanthine dehydrogenase family protein molybdopterin-binding subunit [Candidatus Tectomicrobia bacterium]|nr:xanthine dehydrogenase family protein molybdopterin-binding subunit [Candidatus Tectomicrobia bacterium]